MRFNSDRKRFVESLHSCVRRKTLWACVGVLATCLTACQTFGQVMLDSPKPGMVAGAPDSVAGAQLNMSARRGTPPFANSGKVQRIFKDDAAYYDLSEDDPSKHQAEGNYTFKKNGPASAELQITTGGLNPIQVKVNLSFLKPEGGRYTALLPSQPGSMQMGDFTLQRNVVAVEPTKTNSIAEPSDAEKYRAELRAKGVKDRIPGFSERGFNLLFSGETEAVTETSLAYLYEARVSNPDYQRLAQLSLDTINRVYRNDEFRRREKLEEFLPHIAMKLDKALGRVVLTFGLQREAGEYDFKVGGFRALEPGPVFYPSGAYAIEFSNHSQAEFFKMPKNEADGVAFKRRAHGNTYFFNCYAVVDELGKGTAKTPKVLKGRILGMEMAIGGKSSMGYYNVQTGQWKDNYRLREELQDSQTATQSSEKDPK